MVFPPPIQAPTRFAIHASAHIHTLTPAFWSPLRLHSPCFLSTVIEVVSEGRTPYAVGSKSFRPDIQKSHQMENAVRDI